jgi:NhaP-type Na+/H+ or K+/H+ antiporter
MIMYVPFLFAEMLHLSGIVTILFCGIAARRYVVPNLSEPTEENAEIFFRLAAHLAEKSIFLELGLSVA